MRPEGYGSTVSPMEECCFPPSRAGGVEFLRFVRSGLGFRDTGFNRAQDTQKLSRERWNRKRRKETKRQRL